MAPLISFSGLASGIDSAALIKATLDQQRAVRITPLQSKIASFQDTNGAFSKLKELLGALNTSAQSLRTVNGGAVAKSAASSDETIVTGSASSSAINGSYSINVLQLARSANFSFDDRFASSDTIINPDINDGATPDDRTVFVNVGTGSNQETVEIELTSATTVSEFVSQFNAASSKATASLVNVGTSSSPSYAISIASNNQGTDLGEISVSVGNEITTGGVGAFTSSTITQALDAQLTVSGISGTITKSSNTITDIIPGLTFNLVDTGSATVTVNTDSAATSTKLQQFVDAYNEVLSYIKEQDAVTQEEDENGLRNIFGALASTSIDEGLVTALRSSLTGSSTSGGTVNTLADLGITTERDGSLKFDSATFATALSDDPESVTTITASLGESLGAVDGTLAQYTRFSGIIDTASNANTSEISRLNQRIADLEKVLAKEEESLNARFARLESLIGQLSSQQSTLAQILPR